MSDSVRAQTAERVEGRAGFVRRLSIKRKIMAIILLLTLVGLAFVFAGMTISNRFMFERGLLHDVTVLADIIGGNSRAALTFNDPAVATDILAALRANRRITRAILYDQAGRRFAAYERPGAATEPRPPLAAKNGSVFHNGYLTVIRDIRLDERLIGRLSLTTDLGEWRESLRNFAVVFVLLTLTTVGLTLLLAVALQGIITTPITRLVETARDVSRRQDYSIRVIKTTSDEMGVLVDSFNTMLAEIQRRDRELRDSHALLERRVAERTSQLETLNKELEAFSYSVSHDLRAPLRSIDGFSQALLEDYEGQLDQQGRDYLQRVRAAAQRMAQLIDDILKLSRVTRAELNREEVDLSALAGEIAAELQQAQPEREVKLTIASGLRAEGDPRLLRIALENLLGNAWKFSHDRKPALIEIGMQPQPDSTSAFFVRDNGVGFEMVYADKLFTAFQRLHDTREFPGTGIGLATVQRVIHKHGGKVWAEGEVEKGATFYFSLPVHGKR
jgi:signal transduction histidine kinase